jgi:hypothetical protein
MIFAAQSEPDLPEDEFGNNANPCGKAALAGLTCCDKNAVLKYAIIIECDWNKDYVF